MARMVRKQVYLRDRQDVAIKRLARRRGVSEAEIIRQGIEGHLKAGPAPPAPLDPAAWEEALAFMMSLGPGRARRGRVGRTRSELYARRLKRSGRDSR